MREGWTYKKLGEVCEIICGQDYKKVESPYGKYPIYGTGGIMGYANEFKCPAYSVIVGRKGNINNPIYVEENFWNVDTAFGVVPSKVSLASKFFFYFCKNYDFTKHNVAVTIPSLRRIDLLKIPIPVPPLSEQQRIVNELDLLSSIIDKKKAQLKEYDQLAQSIFFDMFGDPVENEKGWKVKKLGEVYKLKSGDSLSAKQFVDGQYPVYGGNGISGYHNAFNMEGNYIIIGRVGAYCGNVRNVIGKFWLTDNAFQLIYDVEQQNPIFVTYVLTYLDLHQYANHAAQPVISNITLKEIKIPYPPLSLQQSFASKIEAIERQKALIQQSITEVETLFNSRMDYWFS